MNTIEHNKLIEEIKSGKNIDANIKIINSLVSGSNGWNGLTLLIDNHEKVKEALAKVSRRLSKDQCHSYYIHIATLLEELVEERDI